MSWYGPLLGVMLGGLLSLAGIWVKLSLDRKADETRASTIVRDETSDIARHYDRNVSRLRAMLYNVSEHDRWPDVVHIEKLKWPEDTFLFTADSVKNSKASAVAEIYKTRLRIRNANLDADAALRAYQTGDKTMFEKALHFVEERHSRVEMLALKAFGKKQLKRAMIDNDEREEFERASDMPFFDRPLTSAGVLARQPM